jgi:predicted transcriptional regulator
MRLRIEITILSGIRQNKYKNVKNDAQQRLGTQRATATRKLCLTRSMLCITMYNMKTAILTIRLDEDLNRLLDDAAKKSGRNRSDIAREALKRQLRLSQFEAMRKRIMPLAEARGFLTDEDIFSEVS